ncbi:MAG: outer membrane beta-barrel protein [Bacteroidetes bacterium]|nr:outer membrane beta-barrel protein [Bacteroidota bacterium]
MRWRFFLLFIAPSLLHAGNGNGFKGKPQFYYLSYLDAYYSTNLNSKIRGPSESFLYNYNRNNTFSQNLVLLGLNVKHPRYRADLSFQTGTYVADNYKTESFWTSLIHEAKAGIALNRKKSLWVDAGIINSYIGFESPKGIDNATLTRSLAAEASPYYLTGMRLGWERDSLTIAGYLLNGWQTIHPANHAPTPSIGTEIKWKANKTGTLTWNTFLGSVSTADTNRYNRYFSDLYWKQKIRKKWWLVYAFDIGTQQNISHTGWNSWWNSTFIVQYKINKYWRMAVRAEYFHDPHQTATYDYKSYPGFQAYGASFNLDCLIIEDLPIRLEYRYIKRTLYSLGNPEIHTITLTVCGIASNEFHLPTKAKH